MKHLAQHSVSFASTGERFDTITPAGRMVLAILGTFAEYERNTISGRMVNANKGKVGKGLPVTSRPPYGPRINHTGQFEADPPPLAP